MDRREFIYLVTLFSSLNYGCRSGTPKPDDISQIIKRQRGIRRDKLMRFFGLKPPETSVELRDLAEYNPGIEPYLSSIDIAIRENSLEGKIDPLLLLAIARVESSFNVYAISPVGAGGPFQIMPSTATNYGLKVYGLDIYNASLVVREKNNNEYKRMLNEYLSRLRNAVSRKNQEQLRNIDQRFVISLASDAAARILSDNLEETPTIDRAIAAYYSGSETSNRRWLPNDVRRYVGDVKRNYANFRNQLK